MSRKLLTLLGLLFIVLKLTNVVAWSWWLVLLPIYGPMLVGLALLAIFLACIVVGFLAALLD